MKLGWQIICSADSQRLLGTWLPFSGSPSVSPQRLLYNPLSEVRLERRNTHTHTHTHEKGGREPGRESRRKRWRGRKREGMMGECV